MRILILSGFISQEQRHKETAYYWSWDIDLTVAEMAGPSEFDISVFDYDVAIIHIVEPQYYLTAYYNNIPKLLRDSKIVLEQGRTIICIPASSSFRPSDGRKTDAQVYDWLTNFGVGLQENFGEHIKPVAGRAKLLQWYLGHVKRYYQIVVDPQIAQNQRIAVVGDTEINVATEHQVQNGTLVILPPPMLGTEAYQSAMAPLIDVARYYYESGQPTVSFGDSPDWLDTHRPDKARRLVEQIDAFSKEKLKFDRLSTYFTVLAMSLKTVVPCCWSN